MGIIIGIIVTLIGLFMFAFIMGAKNDNPKCPKCGKPMEIIDMTEKCDVYKCTSCDHIEEM